MWFNYLNYALVWKYIIRLTLLRCVLRTILFWPYVLFPTIKQPFLFILRCLLVCFFIMGSNQCLVMNDKTFKNMQEGRERAIRTARLLCRVAPVPFAEHWILLQWLGFVCNLYKHTSWVAVLTPYYNITIMTHSFSKSNAFNSIKTINSTLILYIIYSINKEYVTNINYIIAIFCIHNTTSDNYTLYNKFI